MSAQERWRGGVGLEMGKGLGNGAVTLQGARTHGSGSARGRGLGERGQ